MRKIRGNPHAVRAAGPTLTLALGLLCLSALPVHAQQLITNGGFEAGFTGWTRADQVGSDGTFFLQTGTTSPVNGFPVPAPPQGTQAAMTDAQAGGSHVLYQDFTIPAGTLSGSLSFSLYINSGNDFIAPATLDWAGPTLNQQARVDIMTSAATPFSVAAADIVQNFFQTLPGGALESGYTTFTFDISALLAARQGQTLRLRFAEVDNVSFFNLGVDQVSLQASPLASVAPEPSALALLLTAGSLAAVRCAVRRKRSRRIG
jgi:hypothetical protein